MVLGFGTAADGIPHIVPDIVSDIVPDVVPDVVFLLRGRLCRFGGCG